VTAKFKIEILAIDEEVEVEDLVIDGCEDCPSSILAEGVVLSKLDTWIDAITVKGYVDIGFEEETLTEITIETIKDSLDLQVLQNSEESPENMIQSWVVIKIAPTILQLLVNFKNPEQISSSQTPDEL